MTAFKRKHLKHSEIENLLCIRWETYNGFSKKSEVGFEVDGWMFMERYIHQLLIDICYSFKVCNEICGLLNKDKPWTTAFTKCPALGKWRCIWECVHQCSLLGAFACLYWQMHYVQNTCKHVCTGTTFMHVFTWTVHFLEMSTINNLLFKMVLHRTLV